MKIEDFKIILCDDEGKNFDIYTRESIENVLKRSSPKGTSQFEEIEYFNNCSKMEKEGIKKYIELFGLPRKGDFINFSGDFVFRVDSIKVDFYNKEISIYLGD